MERRRSSSSDDLSSELNSLDLEMLFDEEFVRDVLANLNNAQDTPDGPYVLNAFSDEIPGEGIFRQEATSMGFAPELIEYVISSCAESPRPNKSFDELLENLTFLNETDNASRYDGDESDCVDPDGWTEQAREMGFSETLIAQALSLDIAPSGNFQQVLEALMALQVTEASDEPVCSPAEGFRGEPPNIGNLETLRKENRALRSYFTCKVCLERESEVMVVPCGHMCICTTCSQELSRQSTQCPVCRQPSNDLYSKDNLASLDISLIIPDNAPPIPPEVEAAALEMENNILKTNRVCQSCSRMDRNQYFLPCNHVLLCEDCSARTKLCPSCDRPVNQRMTVYMA